MHDKHPALVVLISFLFFTFFRAMTFGSWTRRYFVLTNTVLQYQESVRSPPLGEVPLALIVRVLAWDANAYGVQKCGITVVHYLTKPTNSKEEKKYNLVISAPTESLRDEWVRAITRTSRELLEKKKVERQAQSLAELHAKKEKKKKKKEKKVNRTSETSIEGGASRKDLARIDPADLVWLQLQFKTAVISEQMLMTVIKGGPDAVATLRDGLAAVDRGSGSTRGAIAHSEA